MGAWGLEWSIHFDQFALIKAPRNVMPVSYQCVYKSEGTEVHYLSTPGDLLDFDKIPKFLSRAEGIVEILDSESEKLRPESMNEDIPEFATSCSLDHLNVIKNTWLVSGKGL